MLLDREGGAAAAGGLDLRILKLEACCFESFNVVDDAAIEVHERSGIDIDIEIVELEDLVHHAALILEGHRVLESGAAPAYTANPKTGGEGFLGGHDFALLGNCLRGQVKRRFLDFEFGCNCDCGHDVSSF